MGKKIFSTQEINKKCYSCRVYAEGNHIISDYINTQEETFLLALSHGCLVIFWNNAVLSVSVLLPSLLNDKITVSAAIQNLRGKMRFNSLINFMR